MQNFAFGRKPAPQDEQDGPELVDCETIDGSGEGKVPGSPNPSLAVTTDAGPPTGFSAVPARGGGCIPIPPPIIPGEPIPGIKPGD